MTLYIVATIYGDWVLDENLNFVPDDLEVRPDIVIQIEGTALAPEETWIKMFETFDEDEVLKMIKPMIQLRMKELKAVAVQH